jgi:hypothetical protein
MPSQIITFKSFLFFTMLYLAACQSKHIYHVYFVTDFGAKNDGKTLATKAIQAAIDAAFEAGGGKVVLTPGTYLSGTIFLKDNVTLEVLSGATLFGSPDTADYTPLVWGHNVDRQPFHLVVIKDANNAEICGGGTIDGNGFAFWKDYDPAKDPQWILAKDRKISPMIEVWNSKNVRLKDVTLLTGGGWTLHLYDSDHLQVQGLKILNHPFSPNGDGIDISGCFDVTISDCIIKTCDDAICLKTAYDTRECKRVAVTNCVIECSCAALKIGNESFKDIEQVTMSNCVITKSSRAIGIYAESCGKVENVTINNIVYDSKVPLLYNRPIHISLFKRTGKSGAHGGYDMINDIEKTIPELEPTLKNITISQFVGTTEGRILITAEEGRMIENLTLRDITLTYPFIEDPEPNIEKAKSSQFSPMNPEAKKAKAALVAENVKNLVIDNFIVNFPAANDTIPADWKFPKRIANGTLEQFMMDYSQTKPCEFSAIWGRNLQNGYIHAPLAKASDKQVKDFDIERSTILVK